MYLLIAVSAVSTVTSMYESVSVISALSAVPLRALPKLNAFADDEGANVVDNNVMHNF